MASRYPTAALGLIALVAFAESVAIVGTVVPAGVVLFGAGVLAAHGTLDLWWTLLAAAAGAVAGDAFSYELGRRQQHRIRAWPLYRRFAGHIAKAERLIARHGALSILIARFTGPARAFVHLLAAFARMTPRKFYASNIASALLWAPVHILPGAVFGASLRLPEQATGRLAVLMLLLAGLVAGAARHRRRERHLRRTGRLLAPVSGRPLDVGCRGRIQLRACRGRALSHDPHPASGA